MRGGACGRVMRKRGKSRSSSRETLFPLGLDVIIPLSVLLAADFKSRLKPSTEKLRRSNNKTFSPAARPARIPQPSCGRLFRVRIQSCFSQCNCKLSNKPGNPRSRARRPYSPKNAAHYARRISSPCERFGQSRPCELESLISLSRRRTSKRDEAVFSYEEAFKFALSLSPIDMFASVREALPLALKP